MRPACLYHESFLEPTNSIQKISWSNSESFNYKIELMNIIDSIKCQKVANEKEFLCTKSNGTCIDESFNAILQTQIPSLQDVETKMYDLHYVLGIEAPGTQCPQENGKFIAVYPYREWIEGIIWPKKSELRSSFVEKNSAECFNKNIGMRKIIKTDSTETFAVKGEFPHLVRIIY